MRIKSITHNGMTSLNLTPEEAVELGYPDQLIAAAIADAESDSRREMIRARIAETAGDTETLLGTTTDAAHLALYVAASAVSALAKAKTIADVQKAAAPLAALTGDFLARIEAGTIKLPFMEKGEAAVVAEIATRATAVTDALTSEGEAEPA